MAMARILVVEDEPDLAFAIATAMQASDHDTRVAVDGPSGLRMARSYAPDLVLVDLGLPGIGGVDVITRLRASGFSQPITVLSACADQDAKVRALDAGADDYIMKPCGASELVARVRAALRRRARDAAPATPTTFRVGPVAVDVSGRRVTRGGSPVPLTPKEFDLLCALHRQRGTAISRAALLQEVWDSSPDTSSRTLDTHMWELRRKLGFGATPSSPITTVYGYGYRLDAAGDAPGSDVHAVAD